MVVTSGFWGACPPKYTTSLGVFTLATAKSAKTTKSAKNTRSAMRPTFAKHPDPIEIPDLLSLQTESFDWLVGNPAWREIAGKDAKTGLDEVFEELSPIEDSANAAQDATTAPLTKIKDEIVDSQTSQQCKLNRGRDRPPVWQGELCNCR